VTAAPILTLTPSERAALGPVERAALAVGTALVAWSRNAARRAAARSIARGFSAHGDVRELHALRRDALEDTARIEAARDLGIHQLWR
jgi:enoyl-CoA hydratase/carnithine racemase